MNDTQSGPNRLCIRKTEGCIPVGWSNLNLQVSGVSVGVWKQLCVKVDTQLNKVGMLQRRYVSFCMDSIDVWSCPRLHSLNSHFTTVMLLCASYSLWVFGPHRLSTSYLGGLTHSRAIGTNSDFSFPVIEMLLFFFVLVRAQYCCLVARLGTF